MPKRKLINGFCGCDVPSTKSFASKNKCADCGNLFCDKHIYFRVDGNNSSITNNSLPYCEDCYIEKYGDDRMPNWNLY
jgi:hypothetical protein